MAIAKRFCKVWRLKILCQLSLEDEAWVEGKTKELGVWFNFEEVSWLRAMATNSANWLGDRECGTTVKAPWGVSILSSEIAMAGILSFSRREKSCNSLWSTIFFSSKAQSIGWTSIKSFV